jgi:hypothetical protein
MTGLEIVPVSFAVACEMVERWHRHHEPPVGMKFCLGVSRESSDPEKPGRELCGVAIVGRPSARGFDNGATLEVVRTATDGHPHANSCLYGACWRAAKALGYSRLITYTQAGETGASLRAAGWQVIAHRPPRKGWTTPSRPREDRRTDNVARTLWEAS